MKLKRNQEVHTKRGTGTLAEEKLFWPHSENGSTRKEKVLGKERNPFLFLSKPLLQELFGVPRSKQAVAKIVSYGGNGQISQV